MFDQAVYDTIYYVKQRCNELEMVIANSDRSMWDEQDELDRLNDFVDGLYSSTEREYLFMPIGKKDTYIKLRYYDGGISEILEALGAGHSPAMSFADGLPVTPTPLSEFKDVIEKVRSHSVDFNQQAYAMVSEKTYQMLIGAITYRMFRNLPPSMRRKYFASKSKLKVKRG